MAYNNQTPHVFSIAQYHGPQSAPLNVPPEYKQGDDRGYSPNQKSGSYIYENSQPNQPPVRQRRHEDLNMPIREHPNQRVLAHSSHEYYAPQQQGQIRLADDGLQVGYSERQGSQHNSRLPADQHSAYHSQHRMEPSSYGSRHARLTQPSEIQEYGRRGPPLLRSHSDDAYRKPSQYESVPAVTQTHIHVGSNTNIGDGYKQINGRAKKKAASKERIIQEPSSPKLSWDNPFPTFPTGRKKGAVQEGKELKSKPESQHQMYQASQKPEGQLKGNQDRDDQPEPQYLKQIAKDQEGERNFGRAHGPAIERMRDGSWEDTRTIQQEYKGTRGGALPRPNYGSTPSATTYGAAHPAYMDARGPRHYADAGRSQTLPNTVSEKMMQTHLTLGQGPDLAALKSHRHQQEDDAARRNASYVQESHAVSGHTGYNRGRSRSSEGHKRKPQEDHHMQPVVPQIPRGQQENYGDLFDSYYDAPQVVVAPDSRHNPRTPPEEDMPNFDALPDEQTGPGRGMSIDQQLHLAPQQAASHLESIPSEYSQGRSDRKTTNIAGSGNRSRSQPDARGGGVSNIQEQGFDFGTAGKVPPLPTPNYLPTASAYDNTYETINYSEPPFRPRLPRHPLPLMQKEPDMVSSRFDSEGHVSLPRYGSPANQSIRHQDSSINTRLEMNTQQGVHPMVSNVPKSPPTGRSTNPDTLPQHPTPVRPGLLQTSPSSASPKPAPVRQYHNTPSPVARTSLSQQPQTMVAPSHGNEQPVPVTHQELQRLQQMVRANPQDLKGQLLLAKKMVEAASVLADEGGRADPKTRTRNRERYVLDAHKIVKKLVNNGYPEAMFYLADCYGRGLLGLAPDVKEAFALYQSAAKAGHAQSAYRVAVCCEMGQEEGGGTRRDPLKAMQWYKRAATLGDTPAMYKMGMIQLKGLLGQPRNSREAIVWLKRAAERADEENPHALHELGLLFESASGNDNIIRDEAYAKQLFIQAAELGYKFSQYRLGTAYEYGSMGCPIDPRQSIAWYSKAAVQEEHQSELALSGWYLTGAENVLQQSDTEAYLWARKAGTAGLAKAEYAMGYFTEVGIGAPANIEDAKRWYWRAASQNFPKARERLEELRRGGAMKQKSRVSRSAVNKQSDSDCVVM